MKQNIIKGIINYLISLVQVSVLTPFILSFFVVIFIGIIYIQDYVSQKLSANMLYILFLGQDGDFGSSDVIKLYFFYMFIFALIYEIVTKIFKIKFVIKLKHKIIFCFSYFIIGYIFITAFFMHIDKFSYFVIPFLFIFSLMSGLLGITISHAIGKFRDVINKGDLVIKN